LGLSISVPRRSCGRPAGARLGASIAFITAAIASVLAGLHCTLRLADHRPPSPRCTAAYIDENPPVIVIDENYRSRHHCDGDPSSCFTIGGTRTRVGIRTRPLDCSIFIHVRAPTTTGGCSPSTVIDPGASGANRVLQVSRIWRVTSPASRTPTPRPAAGTTELASVTLFRSRAGIV
jgi:hypothetical protein